MTTAPSILWFRRDLRLADQAALVAAAEAGAVIPVYILDDDTPKHRRMGGASRWWLHHSLERLDASLRAIGSRLILRRGAVTDVLPVLQKETGAGAIHAIRHYEPWWRIAEKKLSETCPLVLHDGNQLVRPGTVLTGSGDIYKIYTPFWRALNERMPPAPPLAAPIRLEAPQTWPQSDRLTDWNLLPTRPDWATGLAAEWTPGELGAHARIEAFTGQAHVYDAQRNLPSIAGTSRLSPHLHFGEVSPAAIWHAARTNGGDVTTFLKELVWRDYAQNLILRYPSYGVENGKAQFDAMPWRSMDDPSTRADYTAWTKGMTGYPIVDAGMRELWATGWMHNRVRMIAASFLIKHLLIDWRVGEQWFWDTLVDADYASNAANWQWVAGSGVDANMFVRIMAPLTQSPKFDSGNYIRKWVPELAAIRGEGVHDPEEYGCLPPTYPRKRIGHRDARERALAAFARIKA